MFPVKREWIPTPYKVIVIFTSVVVTGSLGYRGRTSDRLASPFWRIAKYPGALCDITSSPPVPCIVLSKPSEG